LIQGESDFLIVGPSIVSLFSMLLYGFLYFKRLESNPHKLRFFSV
jgi:hypothetical protein